jgi:25S rRNA (adenine2142-N1)-methyltransferase
MPTRHKKKRPLAAPPMKSRKKARQLTTAFHKLTRQQQRDCAKGQVDPETEQALADMRADYQRASQVSTKYHSTSRWVLSSLSRLTSKDRQNDKFRVLEVGAINTELLEAASVGKLKNGHLDLTVRAIDLHSMHQGIEQVDFFQLDRPTELYDAIVCSMVLNCVADPGQRGVMLCRCFRFLRPAGGLLFVTIPKSCLTLSPFINHDKFLEALRLVGFDVIETKESPKVSFFICQRQSTQDEDKVIALDEVASNWSGLNVLWRGKKYRNDFGIILDKKSLLGLDQDR